MTPYGEAYETALTEQLLEWADEHKNDTAGYYAAVKDAVQRDNWYGYQGPLGYHVAWKMDAIVKAEYTTATAMFIIQELHPNRTPRKNSDGEALPALTASKVLDGIQRDAKRTMAEGLRSSSSRFHNAVEAAMGEAALDVIDGSFGITIHTYMAESKAVKALTPPDLLQNIKDGEQVVREFEVKEYNARAEHKKGEYRRVSDAAKRDVKDLKAIQERIVEAAKQGQNDYDLAVRGWTV